MLLQPSRTKRLPKRKTRSRALIFRLIGVVALLAVIEFGTRGCINKITSQSIESNTVGVRDVTVASGDPPTVFYYGILGGLRNGSLTLHDVVATPVSMARLEVRSSDLRFSRTKLFTGKARLDGTPPYLTTIYLSPKNLGDYLNATVTFQSENLVATIDGHNMNVVPKLKGREIVIADERFSYEVPLPSTAYLPCKPSGFGIGNGLWISCESKAPPKIVADATS